MLFNSIEFSIFLPIAFAIYWLLGSERRKLQNFFLLLASYIFYGWWDIRFLILIFISTLVDYFVALIIEKHPNKNKIFISISLFFNLGMLGFFKYFNFFAENFSNAFSLFGYQFDSITLNIILPVGISFYTFQTLSYSIDVYRGKIKACHDIIAFFAFVSFFPQLVAGPIERASNLVPQFLRKRVFDYTKAVDGLKQILWGLFKKIVIADSCANVINPFFENYLDYPGADLIICSILFAFQIYCDFSGYSDIAIGTARLFGFNLMRNFAFPYFSRDVAEFWRRWHISLTTWFRDYIYIPLGGSRCNLAIVIRNTFIIYLVSGFWHGARWTFIFWGFINAIYFLPLLILKKNRKNLDIIAKDKFLPNFKEFLQMLFTFILITFSWIFFRSVTLYDAFGVISHCFNNLLAHPASIFLIFREIYFQQILLLLLFIVLEWLGRKNEYAIQNFLIKNHFIFRWIMYYILIIIILFSLGEKQEFIYFQF